MTPTFPTRREIKEVLGGLGVQVLEDDEVYRSIEAGILAGSRAIRPKISVTADEAAQLLHGLVDVNVSQILKAATRFAGAGQRGYFPILKGIQAKTVRYERFDPDEEWKTWSQLTGELKSKGSARGDCEDLASSVVAELRFAGIPARTYVYKSGPALYHVVLSTDRWGILDPSRSAGMEGNG